MALRRALFFTTSERYINIVLTLLTTVILSRLLGPAEMGITVLGSSFLAIAEMIRELSVNNYLVQHKELTLDKTRSAFTITFLISLVVSLLVFALAGTVADFYEVAGLKNYLHVVAFSFLLGPFIAPTNALLRRDMRFGATTFAGLASAIIGAVVAVWLAWQGFSYMSFAWSSLASAVSLAALTVYFRPDFSIFRPSLGSWRSVVAFGTMDTASNILYAIGHDLPYLIFGRMLNTEAVGLFQRATMLSYLPSRILFSGIAPITLPLLSDLARKGEDLRKTLFSILDYVTVLQWPALALLALFAHPVVLVLLGERWMAAVPIVQILSVARLLSLPTGLVNSVLIATGSVRRSLMVNAVSVPITVAVMSLAAMHGLEAVALSMLITIPFYLIVSLFYVRTVIPFGWRELANAVRGNVIVTMTTIIGPVLVMAVDGHGFAVPVPIAIGCLAIAVGGWLLGLSLVQHPLLGELRRATDAAADVISAWRMKRQQSKP